MRPALKAFLSVFQGVCCALMILGSTKLIAQPAFQFPPPDVYQATVNQPPKSHRIEQWELLEEDFTMGITKNDVQADHLREYDSVVLGRGWVPVKYTPAINDLYCPHPPPSDCSENCGIYPAACHHKRLTACNERCKSVEWRTWTYRAALFESAAAAQQEEHHFLQIKQWEGAYIEVYINGKLVKEVNPLVSSFAEVTIDLDGLIKKDGKDSVYIQFASPSQLGALYSERSGMVFPADNEASVTTFGSYGLGKEGKLAAKASPFLRKPIVQYGWDIAPRRVLVGLGEGVFVHGWSDNHLQTLNIAEDSSWMGVESGKAVEYVYGHAELYYLCDTIRGRPDFVRVTSGNLPEMYDDIEWDVVRLGDKDEDRAIVAANEFGVEARYRKFTFRVKNPKHWYPNGLYQQLNQDSHPALYHIEISAHQKDKNGRNQIHEIERNWGVRSVRLDTTGGRFAFSVNGISVFAMGANLIWARQFGDGSSVYPEGLFLGEYGELGQLDVMRAQGYNMVRIWGGGAYPSEAFYDRCDALGIMVWQDLMFNGTMYPDAPNFLEAVESEVLAQSMRLNNHPSLALWCGNNEIEVAWHNWGWQQKYNIHGADSARMWQAYLTLFDTLIPEALGVWSGSVPYTRSSPIGNWGNLQQMKRGDNHDWGVWHGERGFAHLDSAQMPFCSEYGLPSPAEWNWDQDGLTWESTLLSYKGPGLLRHYVKTEYPKWWPHRGIETVEKMDFSDSAAVVQGEFLYRAMISHRMAAPYCMGSLYWQYNDIWNGTTWSVVNTEFGWSILKSSQGRVAEAMLPVVMKLIPCGWWGVKDQFFVQLNSRLVNDCEVPLEVTAYDSLGRMLFEKEFEVKLPGNWQILADGLSTNRVIPISFAGKRKYLKKMDQVCYYSVRLRQPAAAQRLLDLIPAGKHYYEGYPVLEECLWVGAPR
jgi:beta-mannosidase